MPTALRVLTKDNASYLSLTALFFVLLVEPELKIYKRKMIHCTRIPRDDLPVRSSKRKRFVGDVVDMGLNNLV